MSASDPKSAGSTPSMRALGCLGFLFATTLLLLALVLYVRFWSDTQSRVAEVATVSVVVTTPATASPDALAIAGKILPTVTPIIAAPVVPSDLDRRSVPPQAHEEYRRLLDTSAPAHDFYAVAQRLGNFELGERHVAAVPALIGERQTFQTADGPRQADLIYQTDNAAYWVEVGLSLDYEAIALAAQTLETRYLSLSQATFGREWSPGVDLDPRVNILHVIAAANDFELGYFSGENQFPRSLFVHSNERELVYLNMSRLEVGTDLYFGTLVHELQHLAQWNLDANEQVWLNEGFSQLAETFAGLATVDTAPYLARPNTRLDRWRSTPDEVYAHYAGTYLFVRYLWQRAGEQAIRELVLLPDNGLDSIQSILEAYLPGTTLEQFSTDWAVANYLDSQNNLDVQGEQERYTYSDLDLRAPALATRARRLPFSTLNELDQYAVDYIDLDLAGPVRLTFVGETVAPLLESPPPDDGRFWYTALDNSSASSLMTGFVVPNTPGTNLAFNLWYDLESGWDVAYLSVSADGGQSWQRLAGQSSIIGPYGPGWSGRSTDGAGSQNGWVSERFSLDEYAGQPILLRFDVLSDFEWQSRGLAIDNLAVTTTDGNELPLSWDPAGFAETGWLLPQVWGVRLIREGEMSEVIALAPDATGTAQLDVELGAEGGTVVVMPLTSPSAEPARYWLSVESPSEPAD